MNEKTAIILVATALFLAPAAGAQDDLSPTHAPAVVASQNSYGANPECSVQHIPSGGSGQCAAGGGGNLCGSVESCKRFCCCACSTSLQGEWWKDGAYDGRTSCPRSPTSGPGMIAPDSRDLHDLGELLDPKDVPMLIGFKGKRATKAVADGLKALNDAIAGWDGQKEKGFKVRIHNCYRRAVGNDISPRAGDGNTEAVCGMVYKMMRVENSPRSTDANKSEWHGNAENVWGMAWPGQTPHSAGVACDIVLVDGKGRDCFDAAAGPSSNEHCSIKAEEASSILDMAADKTGAWRLDYEAWHYEWGGPKSCRCHGEGCKRFYPPTARVRCS